MGPVFDMFNHSPQCTTMHGFHDSTDCLHVYSTQTWAQGEELFIHYGPLSNTKLAMFYGFAIPNNEFDYVELWATMSPRAPAYELKHAMLTMHGINHQHEPFKIVADKAPLDVIAALRVQVCLLVSVSVFVCCFG